MSIMVEADPRFPDARAAATLIEHLNNLLPAIDLPHEPLIQEAEFLEAQLQSMMEGANIPAPESNSGNSCLLYTSPSPRDGLLSRMPSSA